MIDGSNGGLPVELLSFDVIDGDEDTDSEAEVPIEGDDETGTEESAKVLKSKPPGEEREP